MIFDETEFIDITNEPMCFIYFLLDDDNDVLYVGQTTNGIQRINQHRKEASKEFSKVVAILCDSKELDALELKFIDKYQPIYNSVGTVDNKMKVRNIGISLAKEFNTNREFSMQDIHNMIYCKNIKIRYINDIEYISMQDYFRLYDEFLEVLQGTKASNKLFYL